MDFIASFLEGRDELFVALRDMPATVDEDDGGLSGGHGSGRFFFRVQDAQVRNLEMWKRTGVATELLLEGFIANLHMAVAGEAGPREGGEVRDATIRDI